MFVRLAKRIEARGAADIARRVLQTCGQVMRYAVAHGLAERNPVADVKPGDVLRARRQVNFARIQLDELPELLRRIDAYQGSAYTRLAMRLMLLTFVRTGELIGARWQRDRPGARPSGRSPPSARRAGGSISYRSPGRQSRCC